MKKPIRILTTDFNLLTEIDNYESMFFNRRWYGIGDIEFRINRYKRGTHLLQRGNIVMIGSDLTKAFMIMHKEIELDEQGKVTENWLIKGYSLKSILGRRITIPPVGLAYDTKQGNAETIMKHYIERNVTNPLDTDRKISEIVIATNLSRGPSFSWQSRYENLGEEIVTLALISGLGWSVYLDTTLKKLVFDVMEGRDLTVNQSVLPPVIFSPQFDSLKSLSYTESDLNYKNIAYVGGAGEGELRRVIKIGSTTGLGRHEIFIDARDIQETDENDQPIPEATVIQALTQRGQQQLDQLTQEQYLEGQILTKSPFKYEIDYDLGDLVTIQNKDWNITMDSRITEIKEIYETGGFRIEATFGNNIPTLIDKVRQELSQISGEIRK